ncbi:restriction endonuclease [Nocardia fusca]|uniref:restriction endonuclease n=1 Tax=Nocardia fusca TaxID=941183 RepID=UPI0037C685AA
MPRVEWSLRSGEDVEAVVAMLLCRQNPETLRLRPGQGDGGIDLFLAGPDGAGAERAVYQVKKFAQKLTSSQKRHIRRSFDRVLKTSADEGWKITAWYLVCPLLPTPSDFAWFQTMTSEAGFNCHWHGLDHLNNLASRFPDVIDYYLRDGRDRLTAALEPLAAIIARRDRLDPGQPLTVIDLQTDLAAIHQAINAHDPHYRYSIEMSHLPPDEPPAAAPGLVVISAMMVESSWLIIKIFARARESLNERPIPIELRFNVPEDRLDLRDRLTRFIDYGALLELPAGTVDATFDLPGGLGGTYQGGSVRIGGVTTMQGSGSDIADDEEIRVGVLAGEDDVLAEVLFTRRELTDGAAGRRTVWRDPSDTVTLELLQQGTRLVSIDMKDNFQVNGRRPGDLAATLQLCACMHAPHQLYLAPGYGPRTITPIAAIKGEPDREITAMARTANALNIVQPHLPHRLLMPAGLTADQARRLDWAARLLEGQPIRGTWPTSEITVNLHDGEPRLSLDQTYHFCLIRDLDVELSDRSVHACQYAGVLDGVVEAIDDHKVRIRLLDTRTTIFRFTGDNITDGTVLSRALTHPAHAQSTPEEAA